MQFALERPAILRSINEHDVGNAYKLTYAVKETKSLRDDVGTVHLASPSNLKETSYKSQRKYIVAESQPIPYLHPNLLLQEGTKLVLCASQ